MRKTFAKRLALFSACALLPFIVPISANADSISLGTSLNYGAIGSSSSYWTYMPANDTISSFPTTLNGTSLTDSLGVFSYKTGTAPNNNVVDVTLTLTPTIGSQTTNLNFYGTLDQGFLSFDLAGNPNAVTVNTDYTALLFDGYYFGVYNGASDQGFQLSQGGPGKLTWIPGYVSTANAVPEPSALGLTTVAALGLIAFGLKRKKQHTQQ